MAFGLRRGKSGRGKRGIPMIDTCKGLLAKVVKNHEFDPGRAEGRELSIRAGSPPPNEANIANSRQFQNFRRDSAV